MLIHYKNCLSSSDISSVDVKGILPVLYLTGCCYRLDKRFFQMIFLSHYIVDDTSKHPAPAISFGLLFSAGICQLYEILKLIDHRPNVITIFEF